MRQEGTAPPHMGGLYGPSQHVLQTTEEQVTNVLLKPSQCMLADSYPESGARHTFGLHAASSTDLSPCSPLFLKRSLGSSACMPTAITSCNEPCSARFP